MNENCGGRGKEKSEILGSPHLAERVQTVVANFGQSNFGQSVWPAHLANPFLANPFLLCCVVLWLVLVWIVVGVGECLCCCVCRLLLWFVGCLWLFVVEVRVGGVVIGLDHLAPDLPPRTPLPGPPGTAQNFALFCRLPPPTEAAGASHDNPRAQTCTFEGPDLHQNHQNSTRRHQREEIRCEREKARNLYHVQQWRRKKRRLSIM